MVAPPFYNTYYGINTNCYDLCNIRQTVVNSVEGVVKRGSNHVNHVGRHRSLVVERSPLVHEVRGSKSDYEI